jgi:hypothetical protein
MMTSLRTRRLLICVYYQSPWDRLSGFFWGVKKDNTLRWEIPANPRGVKWVLAKLGDWTDKRDHAWREKYAQASKNPPDRWKRRTGDDREACRLPGRAAH